MAAGELNAHRALWQDERYDERYKDSFEWL
jgi:hypothetical protein